ADLRGPAACELGDVGAKRARHARLGPDPLRRDADPEAAWTRISRSRSAVGALLLDQRVLSGVGNVYRAEVLFRAGVSPFRPGREVAHATWTGVWDDLVRLMRAGVRAGRIVTTEPEDRPSGRSRASRAESFYVYERGGLPCRRCGTAISAAVLGARRIVWCPTCQPGWV
ncbi:MAG TPA: zinc finger domain-containing protein, partial [Jiangellales bacterium]|nr:zinc finger domain-containing protein [Jiangellales bacterium]